MGAEEMLLVGVRDTLVVELACCLGMLSLIPGIL